ncbi:MAG: hypothetical protein BCS36_11830 [Desulfovibrio sp. MES5]|uniref:hypothetical protein n=1 Tax=Desulfovibrio sp. MES5 TaxID=1899016 RepID=UPI000B9C797C|nr:hypothetical protein [Desulfovibrio sp. MES5]OXS30275.1 MAG: hypothetical protein BCS36_11830 [Desulfovibrio sp. MES5]
MKKLLKTLIILAILVAGGLTALGFGLRSSIQEQVLNGLSNLSRSPQGKPYAASADQVEFSPFTREIFIRGLALRGEQANGPETWLASEISFRLPLRMLLALTPLRIMILKGNEPMDIAENVVVRNIAMTTPNSRVLVQREEMDVIRATPFVIGQALEGHEPIDMITATYDMGADNTSAHFVSADIIDANGSVKVSFKEMRMSGWKGRSIASLAIDDMEVRIGGAQTMAIGRMVQEGIALPEEDMMRQLMALSENPEAKETQEQLIPLMETILNYDPPLLRKFQATDMTFAVDTSTVQVKESQFEWFSNTPTHTKSSITGLTASSRLLHSVLDMTLPPLNVDMVFESRTTGAVSHKTAEVRAPGLGQIACSLNTNDKPGSRMAEEIFTQSFSDFTLSYKDDGAVAWMGLNLFPNVPQAAATIGALAALPGIRDTPQNAVIRQNLQAFAARPGSLDIKTTPGRTVLVLDLIAMLDNPGMLLTIAATPGDRALVEQMEVLRLTFEAVQVMNAQQQQ